MKNGFWKIAINYNHTFRVKYKKTGGKYNGRKDFNKRIY